MKFINLTPHAVTLSNGALKIHFEKDSRVPTARVEQVIEEQTIDYEIAEGMTLSIPVNAVTRTTVYGLPEPQEGVIYICSSMVATYVKRPDVVSPITDSTCERDANGRVLSVKGFQTFCTKSDETYVPVPVMQTYSWQEIDRIADKAFEEMERNAEQLQEVSEELAPVAKVDVDMLDPIKAAAKAKAKEKYLKRTGRA